MRTLLSILAVLTFATPVLAQEKALVPLEVRPGPAFRAAVENGTRTATGEPGPAYWQQAVHYDVDVTVEPSARSLTGRETVRYDNHSPDTLKMAFFHLYQNLFAEGALRTRSVPLTGGMTIESLSVDGVDREVATDDNRHTIVDGTVMTVRLPEPLLPGASATFEIAWRFTIPAGENVPRMGMVDSTTGQVAQWYPQIATYDDLRGWDTRQYLSNGEFYLEYGDWDLSVTVPAGYLVAATGTLENPAEVLPAPIRDRLARATGDEVVHVVTASDFGPGKATLGASGETLTWRFHAEHVRDAAFAFGDHYLWDATTGLVDEEAGRRTAVHSLYRPSASTWVESARMTKDAIETFSRNVYPYAYPHITSTEGLVGGMEYPMIVFVRDFPSEAVTDRVIAHELGHMWFPMMVGSDETSYAWMDEGVNTFITIFAAEHWDPASGERASVKGAYGQYARQSDTDFDVMDPPDAVAAGGGSVGILGYRHPATALLALRNTIGHETFDAALTEYADRWLYRHPTPWDFFDTVEDVAGRDLDWFWVPWFYGPGVNDLAIEDVDVGDGEVAVTVRNEGTVLVPVKIRVTTDSGETVEVEAGAERWFDGRRSLTVKTGVDGGVARVELDPDDLFADTDDSDDVWTSR